MGLLQPGIQPAKHQDNIRTTSYRNLTTNELINHPNANVVEEHTFTPNEKTFYKTSIDSLSVISFVAGTGEELTFTNPGVLFEYPIYFNTMHTDSVAYQYEVQGTLVKVKSKMNWIFSGQEVLITPTETFNNTFKVMRYDSIDYYVQGNLVETTNSLSASWYHETSNKLLAKISHDDLNSTTTGVFIKSSSASLTSGLTQNKLLIYPNPAENTINFSIEVESFELLDLSGKTLIKGSGSSINTYDIPSGTYLIKTIDQGIETIGKIIKE